jgi:hypothetical protein
MLFRQEEEEEEEEEQQQQQTHQIKLTKEGQEMGFAV